LRFEPASFDAVFAANVLHLVPDLEAARRRTHGDRRDPKKRNAASFEAALQRVRAEGLEPDRDDTK
jgi:hypothetical protein